MTRIDRSSQELRIQYQGEPWRILFAFDPLRSVVNALGGTIEIIVRVPDKDPILLSDYQE